MYDRKRLSAWPHRLPHNAPLPLRAMREIRTGHEVPEAALREVQAVYYGMITRTDLLIGRFLEAVEENGLLDESVLVFTSDHGDFAGQYGLVEKWDTCFADCLMHVPCILWARELPHGKSIDSLTEHTDLAPTILELLGLRPDWGIHGESLLPIIRGEKRKEAIFADGGHEQEMWTRFDRALLDKPARQAKQEVYHRCPEAMARAKMVRTERWKLVVRLTEGHELYNLSRDPWELNNVFDDPGNCGVILELQQKMLEWCLRTDTDRPYQKDVGA